MRLGIKLILLFILTIPELSCVHLRHVNLAEGISCFRVQNYRDAFIHLRPEAEKGQPDAQYAVGYMYYYGKGVVENRKQAWFWIEKAARAGQADAITAARILKCQPIYRSKDHFDKQLYYPVVQPVPIDTNMNGHCVDCSGKVALPMK
jgi:TPR repeat protein